jgi:hypothetical protein
MSSMDDNGVSRVAWLAATGILGAGLVYFGKSAKSPLIGRITVAVGSGLIVKCVSQSIIGVLSDTES